MREQAFFTGLSLMCNFLSKSVARDLLFVLRIPDGKLERVSLSFYLSAVCLSIYLSICVYVYLSIYRSDCSCLCLSIYVSVYLWLVGCVAGLRSSTEQAYMVANFDISNFNYDSLFKDLVSNHKRFQVSFTFYSLPQSILDDSFCVNSYCPTGETQSSHMQLLNRHQNSKITGLVLQAIH